MTCEHEEVVIDFLFTDDPTIEGWFCRKCGKKFQEVNDDNQTG